MPSADYHQELLFAALRQDMDDRLTERGGWRASVDTPSNIGNLDIAGIDGLSPFEGLSVIVTEAGTPAATGSDTVAIGDIIEYQGAVLGWRIVTPNANGVPPDDTRVPLAWAGAALVAPHQVGVHEGMIAVYDGTSLYPREYITPKDGDTITCNGGGNNNSLKNQRKFAFEGQVPTGTWVDTGGLLSADIGDGLERDPLTGVLQLKDGDVALVKLASMSESQIMGRASGAGTGAPQHLTAEQARTVLGVTGDLAQIDAVRYAGSRTLVQIDALSPTKGESYVFEGVGGTPAVGSSDLLAEGDITEFDGVSWKKIVANVGGYPPDGTRAMVAPSALGITLQSPLTDPTDSNKLAVWDGTSLTPDSLTSYSVGQTVTVRGGIYVGGGLALTYFAPLSSNLWLNPGQPVNGMADGMELKEGLFPTVELDGATLSKSASGVRLSTSLETDISNNAMHAAGSGSDHADVAANTAHATGGGSDHADVATNTAHSTGDGSDHADVATNSSHVAGDGSDHADVASNNAHRGSAGLDHSYLKDNLVDVVVAVDDAGGGATTATILIDVKDLSGAALAKQCQFVLQVSTTQYGGSSTPNANCTLGSFTKGQAYASDGANGRWLLQTDAAGQIAAVVTNTTDETVWFSVHTADGGVQTAGQGVIVRGCVPDDATWSA